MSVCFRMLANRQYFEAPKKSTRGEVGWKAQYSRVSIIRTKCKVLECGKRASLESGFEEEQVEHVAHVDERLAHLAVDGAEEVERHREVQEEAVDHHEVADGHAACEASVKPVCCAVSE